MNKQEVLSILDALITKINGYILNDEKNQDPTTQYLHKEIAFFMDVKKILLDSQEIVLDQVQHELLTNCILDAITFVKLEGSLKDMQDYKLLLQDITTQTNKLKICRKH